MAKAMPTRTAAARDHEILGLKIAHDGLPRGTQRAANADLLPPLRHPITGQADDSECRYDEKRNADAHQQHDETVIAAIRIGAHLQHRLAVQNTIFIQRIQFALGRLHDGIELSRLHANHVIVGFADQTIGRQHREFFVR